MKSLGVVVFFFIFVTSLNAHESVLHVHKPVKVSLQLPWKYQFEFAGFIAAKEKGFYRNAGLDVTLKEYQEGMDVIEEVLSHRADFGLYNSSVLLEYLKGKPLVLLSSFFKRSALVLLTQPSIKSVKDLKGKSIVISERNDFELNFKPYFNGYGMDLNEMKIVHSSSKIDDFVHGRVDAIAAFISKEPYELDKMKKKYNILNPSDENIFVLQEELFSTEDTVQKKKKVVDAFKQASIKGWKYALSHKEEIAAIIHNKYAPNISLEALNYEAEALNKLILPFIYDIGAIDENFLHKLSESFEEQFKLEKKRTLEDFLILKEENSLDLTPQEKKYIQEHPKIPVCINYDFFPIDAYQNNVHTGIMADVYTIISKKTGLEFIPVASNSEANLKQNLEEKKCKLLSVVATNNVNFKTIKPTSPLSSTSFTLLSRLENSFVDNPLALKGKILLVQKESFKDYLNYLYPYLNIELEEDKNQMVSKVLDGRAYGIVAIDEQADYFIDKYGYGKLKINAFLAKEHLLHGSIGVQKDEPVLYGIMQKVIKTFPKDKIERIENKWSLTRYHERIDYSLVWIVIGVVSVILLIMFYYQRKLKGFNKILEQRVAQKTKELQKANTLLKERVEKKAQELIQKDKILTSQSRQAVMGEMISMIAHQWRQPLNTITLQVSSLQLKYMMGQEISKEEVLQTLEDISDSIVYLSETIDDFKTYFHPDKVPEDIELESLLQRSMKFVLPRIKSKKIKIFKECDKELHMYGYKNELIQVLLNILNNAVDAYENRNFDDKIIKITCKLEGKNVKISISDRAGGIRDEYLPKLFEPYFSTKGKNGTGLGLYMSKMIIEKQFGGTIDVKSSVFGTTFTIIIPQSVQNTPLIATSS